MTQIGNVNLWGIAGDGDSCLPLARGALRASRLAAASRALAAGRGMRRCFSVARAPPLLAHSSWQRLASGQGKTQHCQHARGVRAEARERSARTRRGYAARVRNRGAPLWLASTIATGKPSQAMY